MMMVGDRRRRRNRGAGQGLFAMLMLGSSGDLKATLEMEGRLRVQTKRALLRSSYL